MSLGVSESELSSAEYKVTRDLPTIDSEVVSAVAEEIRSGRDPLGDTFCRFLSTEERRPKGQTFTPEVIVNSMVDWTVGKVAPARIVDPGAGSGRYIVSALLRYPDAVGIASETDPYAALMTRANAYVGGVADRLTVVLGDYRELELPSISGRTLFIGNPPYVRHHNIPTEWKEWLSVEAKRFNLKASKLAGLHVHFFLATAKYAKPGDLGTFITSSEWLDVNYGKLVRELLVDRLAVSSLHIIDPRTEPFEGTSVTGTITCFEVGSAKETVQIQNVSDLAQLGNLSEGFTVSRNRLAEASRWSVLTRVTPTIPDGYVELGEIARVHRGAVTGANKTWVVEKKNSTLPSHVLYPAVTKAKELFCAGGAIGVGDVQKAVIDLPSDLDVLTHDERVLVDRFLKRAKRAGVDQGYVARTRPTWWRVGLKEAAPILATYMARRPPAFVRNEQDIRHINIAHGVYPREQLSPFVLDRLAEFLRSSVSLSSGRTYAGGLTKFEPREMERLVVPSLELLRDRSCDVSDLSAPLG